MRVALFTLAALFSAALHIYTSAEGPRVLFYISKPLTILLIIALAAGSRQGLSLSYRTLILAGLSLSLVGDVFLMLPGDYFLPGLVSFLLAHIVYSAAFRFGRAFRFSISLLSPFLLFSAAFFFFLSPGLNEMKIPVLVYIAVITVMGWQALDRFMEERSVGSLYALLGAILFSLSDSILAFDRFKGELEYATLLIMSTYYLAQWFIALSARDMRGT